MATLTATQVTKQFSGLTAVDQFSKVIEAYLGRGAADDAGGEE